MCSVAVEESNLAVFREITISFDLQADDGGTTVRCRPEYTLRYGPVGKVLDRLMIRRAYSTGMERLLAGLKEHVEAA